MNIISPKILALMAEKDLSYADLSALTGIPKSSLQRYVSGTTEKIPLDCIAKIAPALGVTAAALLGWNDDGSDCPSLADRRKALGKTQHEVAQEVGVSESAVSRWESGEIANMRRDRIKRYAAALETTPAVIMADCDADPAPTDAAAHNPPLSEAGARIGSLYDMADEHDKHIVETVLEKYLL